jgi:hypothetical protein
VPYVFNGNEVLTDMVFCRDGKEVVDHSGKWRVPKGTQGWTTADMKKAVIFECQNDAKCEGCTKPKPTPPVPAPECACAPAPPPAKVEVRLPPPPADVPIKKLPPPPPEWRPR